MGDRLHGSRSSVDARGPFLSPVITRYTQMQIASRQIAMPTYRSFSSRALTVGISHACAESRVRALPLPHRRAVMCVRATITHDYVKPAGGWVVPGLSRIYYSEYSGESHFRERVRRSFQMHEAARNGIIPFTWNYSTYRQFSMKIYCLSNEG